MRTRAENCFLYSIHTIGYDSGAHLRGYCVEGGEGGKRLSFALRDPSVQQKKNRCFCPPPSFPVIGTQSSRTSPNYRVFVSLRPFPRHFKIR